MPVDQPNSSQGSSSKRRRRRRGRSGGGQGNSQTQQRPPQQSKKKSEERAEPREVQPAPPHKPRRYGILFYDTLVQARQDKEAIATKAQEVDQLNIVIRAESDMDDPELTAFGKVFAGAAWTLIHERRVQDGWYEKPQ